MKKIEAIIRPEKFEEVKRDLEKAGCLGMTITEVMGRGRQKGQVHEWRGREYTVELPPKVKVEIVVDDTDLQKFVQVILDAACTGSTGDGKIFVYDVVDVVRVRTGERGKSALT